MSLSSQKPTWEITVSVDKEDSSALAYTRLLMVAFIELNPSDRQRSPRKRDGFELWCEDTWPTAEGVLTWLESQLMQDTWSVGEWDCVIGSHWRANVYGVLPPRRSLFKG